MPDVIGAPLPPSGALELVGLARVRPRGGIGLAVAAAWSGPSQGVPARWGERISLVLRTAGQEDGAFDPYVELLAGAIRMDSAPGSRSAARWGTETRAGGGVGWYVGRSLRLGVGLALGTALLPRRDVAAPDASTRSWRLIPSLAAGFETTVCFGPAH